MSQSTVKAHVHNIIAKLHVHNRTAAAVARFAALDRSDRTSP
jgi:DNA-binding NarL/FixJ family response regulator